MMPMAAEGVTVLQTEMSWREDEEDVRHVGPNPSWRGVRPHLGYLLQQLELLHVVVPLDPQAVGHRLQTLPHVLQAAANHALALVAAHGGTRQRASRTGRR